VVKRLADDARKPPVSDALQLLRRVVAQDLEPDPNGGGVRIRDGVAEDRVISVGDPEMWHARKSRSKTIRGFKRHIVIAKVEELRTAESHTVEGDADPTGSGSAEQQVRG
jgi:hypothetical protein